MGYPRQVVELAQPFPEKFVHRNPSGGGSYIKHHVIEQRLIQVFGRPPTFERVEIVFGDVAEIKPNPNGSSDRAKEGRPALKQVIVGVVARMTVTIDGHKVVVEEVGDCEQPHNWDSDGQRLKDAFSDAYKRCAMRLGCGLHLWSQDEYFLHDELLKVSQEPPDEVAVSPQRDDAAPVDDSAEGVDGATQTPAEAQAVANPTSSTDQSQQRREGTDGKGDGRSQEVSEVAPAPAVAAEDWTTLLEEYGLRDVLEIAQQVAKEKGEKQPFSRRALLEMPDIFKEVAGRIGEKERVA